ncbi:unnamed protein product [Rotaria magnacalcarata]|nr:unnamed protein product [Rotaria magnacalcarata]
MTKSKISTISVVSEVKSPLVCSHRLLLAILACFGFLLCYAQRNGFSVSIVCMVHPDADNTITHANDSVAIQRNIPVSCHKHTIAKNQSRSQILFWPKKTRGIILGSFYWGYALTQVISSVIVNKMGPQRFLALVIFISSLSTLMIPILSEFHPSGVVVARVIAGAAQGGLWPANFRFWSTWAPAAERTTLISIPNSG